MWSNFYFLTISTIFLNIINETVTIIQKRFWEFLGVLGVRENVLVLS